ncbi:MAG: hypothetical protein ACK4K9_08165 [Bacteroidia bacterium]
MKISIPFWVLLIFATSCTLVGDKNNKTANEVFEKGKVDPNLQVNNVGYVPVYPFFNGIQNPLDVFVGYDQLIYVVAENDEADIMDNEVLVYDQRGTLSYKLKIPGATDVVQDRRLHTYIAGRVKRPGGIEMVAAVYRIANIGTGSPVFADTLIHYLCDESRTTTTFRGPDDVAVSFTGLACLFDNTLYVARIGPKNDLTGFVRPDNGILVFDPNGVNIGFSFGLNPNESSLKTTFGISGIASYIGPPQRLTGLSTSKNFVMALGNISRDIEYRVLGISVFDDPDAGTQYNENTTFLNFDKTKADRFLYEPYRFKQPYDVYIAPDITGYIFVTDIGTDSIYIFTNTGFEGVNPPANTNIRRQIIASFGGSGADGKASGPFNFIDPTGICYHSRTIFVCDKGNNRICRYRLNTDLE